VFEKLVHLYTPQFSKRTSNERRSLDGGGDDDEPAKKIRKSSTSPLF